MPATNKLLLSGLTEREAAAVQMMVESTWRDWGCVVQLRQANFQMPQQDAAAQACAGLIVNLLGVGLLRHNALAQSQLCALLAGRSAVLLLHSGDNTWAAAQWQQAPGQTLIWLMPPCSSEALRTAIRQSGMLNTRQLLAPAPAVPPSQATPQATAKATYPGARPPAASQPEPTQAATTQHGHYQHMGNGALEQLERALPALQHSDWLRLIKKALDAGGRNRFQIGPTAFVMDMQAGWLASTLPSSALQKMLQTPQLLASVQIQRLSQDGALGAGRSRRFWRPPAQGAKSLRYAGLGFEQRGH
ncbi:MAG: hypothetical protein ACH34Y_08125 [Brachymonas sp.]|jgi:hypothetical protein